MTMVHILLINISNDWAPNLYVNFLLLIVANQSKLMRFIERFHAIKCLVSKILIPADLVNCRNLIWCNWKYNFLNLKAVLTDRITMTLKEGVVKQLRSFWNGFYNLSSNPGWGWMAFHFVEIDFGKNMDLFLRPITYIYTCVYVCVCVWVRERERGRESVIYLYLCILNIWI